ncbi:hypothetical protein EMCG_06679 [[Emmonsia] crescens]|uniref:Uncharacterized protein n=1 Tax=[Emmonsia] crescens TaxID=73230 RepID=A0A0G2J6G8_9EURO|nr:hypothetical protein EMCG_06679 [Emmonsia crescens UAMH 3008]
MLDFGSIGKDDTIYHDKAGFDDIDFEKISLVCTVPSFSTCAFLNLCTFSSDHDAMQFHKNGDPRYACDCIRDLNRFCCEIGAYVVLNGPKYVILALCLISMVLF